MNNADFTFVFIMFVLTFMCINVLLFVVTTLQSSFKLYLLTARGIEIRITHSPNSQDIRSRSFNAANEKCNTNTVA